MALIIAQTAEQASDYARRLLDTAADPAEVQTVTDVADGVVGFEVSDELADKAGFGETAPDPEPVTPVTPPSPETPATEAPTETPEEAPARNASRAVWADWLTRKEVAFDADAGRDELVALWDAHQDS